MAPPSEEDGELTHEEERQEERRRREFDQSRTDRLSYPNDIPQASFTRAYEPKTTIDTFRPHQPVMDWDNNSTMPLEGAMLESVVDKKLAGRLSLLEALKFKDWEAVRAHTTAAASRVADGFGRLPLLLALTGGAPVDASLGLLRANPEAATQADSYGNLPLHVAITRQLELELVLALHDAHPDASFARDEFEDLPLHLVLKQTQPVEKPEPEAVPEAVEEAEPEPEVSPWWATAQTFSKAIGAEKRGDAHREDEGGAPAKISGFSALLAAAKVDVATPPSTADDGSGPDPLGAWQLAVARALLASNPEGVAAESGAGKHPLHMSTENRTAMETVLLLLDLIGAILY